MNATEKIQRKYNINFSVPIKKELDNGKAIRLKLEFIDSFRFMSTWLSRLTDSLSTIYSRKCRDANLSVILMGLKITNFLIIAKSVEKDS